MTDSERLDEIQRRLDRLALTGGDDDDLAGAMRRLRERAVSMRMLGNALRNGVIAKLDGDEHSGDVARWDAEIGSGS